MIQNERELKVALEWIDYWKSTRTGAQSWIGNEQAAQKIAELREKIDAYRRRQPAPASASPEARDEDQSISSTV